MTIEAYMSTHVAKPPSTRPAANTFTSFERQYFTKANPPSSTATSLTQAGGSLYYAVAGWARWNTKAHKNAGGNLLFSLSAYS